MNNIISNPKTEVPTGKEINEKDAMNLLLSCLKDIIKNYAIILTEVSNENLYNKYKIMFDEFSKLQREVYELIFKKGWYQLEICDEEKVYLKWNLLNQQFNDLNQQ